MAIGNQRGSALHVGLHESFDRLGGIVGDHGKTDAAKTCIEVLAGLRRGLLSALRRGLILFFEPLQDEQGYAARLGDFSAARPKA